MEIFMLFYFGGWGVGILAVVAGLIFWFVRRQRELKLKHSTNETTKTGLYQLSCCQVKRRSVDAMSALGLGITVLGAPNLPHPGSDFYSQRIGCQRRR